MHTGSDERTNMLAGEHFTEPMTNLSRLSSQIPPTTFGAIDGIHHFTGAGIAMPSSS
jgi:hypothetical protein